MLSTMNLPYFHGFFIKIIPKSPNLTLLAYLCIAFPSLYHPSHFDYTTSLLSLFTLATHCFPFQFQLHEYKARSIAVHQFSYKLRKQKKRKNKEIRIKFYLLIDSINSYFHNKPCSNNFTLYAFHSTIEKKIWKTLLPPRNNFFYHACICGKCLKWVEMSRQQQHKAKFDRATGFYEVFVISYKLTTAHNTNMEQDISGSILFCSSHLFMCKHFSSAQFHSFLPPPSSLFFYFAYIHASLPHSPHQTQ